jgi:hypothetical protein
MLDHSPRCQSYAGKPLKLKRNVVGFQWRFRQKWAASFYRCFDNQRMSRTADLFSFQSYIFSVGSSGKLNLARVYEASGSVYAVLTRVSGFGEFLNILLWTDEGSPIFRLPFLH